MRAVLELVLLQELDQLGGAFVRSQELLLGLHLLEGAEDVGMSGRRRHHFANHRSVQRAC